MKKYFIWSAVIISIGNSAFAQNSLTQKHPLSRQEYLQKSKTQRTAGWIFLGIGIASIAAVSSGEKSFETTGTVAVLGGLSVLGSIPLFISAAQNKTRAKAVSAFWQLENMPGQNYDAYKHLYLASLSIRVDF